MMDRNEMNNVKDRLDILFNFSSQVSYSDGHLLQVIQACKSLLGVSRDHVSIDLLRWLDSYVGNFKPNNNFEFNLNSKDSMELLSTFELENLINKKDKDKTKKYLYHLAQVSDPKYLMEILFEISLQRTNKEILFCWAAYKSVKFMDHKDGMAILFIALDCLLSGCKTDGKEVDLLNFFVICHSYQILMTDMVRIKTISLKLTDFKNNNKNLDMFLHMIPESLLQSLREDKEKGFGKYVSNLKISEINEEYIFLLDAIRSLYNYADESDEIYRLMMGVC